MRKAMIAVVVVAAVVGAVVLVRSGSGPFGKLAGGSEARGSQRAGNAAGAAKGQGGRAAPRWSGASNTAAGGGDAPQLDPRGRPGEPPDPSRDRLRAKFVEMYQEYLARARVRPEQEAAMRSAMADAQTNLIVTDYVNKKTQRDAELATFEPHPALDDKEIEQMVASNLEARIASTLDPDQMHILRRGYRHLLRANGYRWRPFDLDELKIAGIDEDQDRKVLARKMLERYRDLPVKSPEEEQQRQRIVSHFQAQEAGR